MPLKEYQRILKSVRDREFKPVYFLQGTEPYFIDVITKYLEMSVLDESEKAFNQTVVYGKDVSFDELVETVKRFPMMAPYQVVIVKEAQSIRNLKEKLLSYLQSPVDTTILVVCYKYKKISDRKFLEAIKSKGVFFDSKELRDDRIPEWIIEYVRRKKLNISPKSILMISEYLGNNLSKISNELDKLALILEPGSEITTKDIEENIGISKDYNSFELVNALGKKDALKANRIVNYFADNKKSHPLVLTLASVYAFYSKLLAYYYLQDKSTKNVASSLKINPYFLKDYLNAARQYNPAKVANIIHEIRECDRKSKGIGNSSVPEGELLKELVFKILH
ncbi:DNA polymerase III subunit delta [bacterium SCSIO 12741]|nr:DNA polymerase III subunit delta [bacterium SCSIO 12741]